MSKPPRNNLSGQTFGRLTVTDQWHTNGDGKTTYFCLCKECGRHKWIRAQSLTSGRTISCGCMAIENRCKSIINTKKCTFCGSVFLAFGKAKFCSTKCRATEGRSRRSPERRCRVCNERIPYGEYLTKSCGRPACNETIKRRNSCRAEIKRRGSIESQYVHAISNCAQHLYDEKERQANEQDQPG
jgi:hypothetical protein